MMDSRRAGHCRPQSESRWALLVALTLGEWATSRLAQLLTDLQEEAPLRGSCLQGVVTLMEQKLLQEQNPDERHFKYIMMDTLDGLVASPREVDSFRRHIRAAVMYRAWFEKYDRVCNNVTKDLGPRRHPASLSQVLATRP